MSADNGSGRRLRSFVYVGPSAPAEAIRALLPDTEIRPPIQRGDLYTAREQGVEALLILDGMFAHNLAVSPREVVDVCRDGALIVGAASMGALRAAECQPAGVLGVGLIYRLFRAGVLVNDDEVAVAMDPEREFSAASEALVNIRHALSRAVRSGIASRAQQRRIMETATRTYFAERSWPRILSDVGLSRTALAEFVRLWNLKRDDALRAAAHFAHLLSDHRVRNITGYTRPRQERYPGHDRHLGLPPERLRGELLTWLFGSGRYQRYAWSLVCGEPELRDVPCDPDDRPQALRVALAGTLARLLKDEAAFARRLWRELEFLDELDAELMLWFAIRAAAGSRPSANSLARVREEVAIAHGVRDWSMLEECVEDGALWGAIPLHWINEACSLNAAARDLDADMALAGGNS